jgi:hypothetical protein
LGDFIIEVKPASKLEDPEVRQKFDTLRACYRDRGQHLVVVTDEWIRVQPRLDNLNLVLRERRRSYCGLAGFRLATALEQHLPGTLADLAPFAGGKSVVMALVAAGHLHCDLGLSLNQALFSAPKMEFDYVATCLSK